MLLLQTLGLLKYGGHCLSDEWVEKMCFATNNGDGYEFKRIGKVHHYYDPNILQN